ncbi:MAG: DUF5050 domain-containing protein [Chloroflexaceae bacterium]
MKHTGLFVLTLLFTLTLLVIPAPHPVAAQTDPVRIVFASDRDGNSEIYAMNADGSEVTRLTNYPADEGDPAWSPDNSQIVFTSDRDGNSEIYVMNADGSGIINISNHPAADIQPAWSPDGRIAFTSDRDGNYEVYVMNADGSGVTNVSNHPDLDGTPGWSSDGTRIAFTSARGQGRGIYVINADGTGIIRLSEDTYLHSEASPDWSPDGTQIVFQTSRGQLFPAGYSIGLMNADGSGITGVYTDQGENFFPSWSPDGTRIAFARSRARVDEAPDIYLINPDGSGEVNLTNNPAVTDTQPDWSNPVLPTEPPSANARCFEETGYCIDGRIREYWEQNGGLPVFGLPIGPQQPMNIEGKTVQAQWFERNRLELHPENAPPYDVLLGRLGADRLAQQGYDWQAVPGETAQEGCRFFEETGRNVCGDILAAWRANGLELDGQRGFNADENLALFGLPLTGMVRETMSDGRELQVQYFERARFELHPENEPPFHVQLGLLGSEVRGAR